jgi:hypothetical protein
MRSRNGGAIYEIVKPTNEEKLNALKQAVLKQLAKKDLSDADLLNELRQLKKLKKIIGQFDIYSIVVALGSLQKDGLVYWQIAEGGGAVWHLRSNNIKP